MLVSYVDQDFDNDLDLNVLQKHLWTMLQSISCCQWNYAMRIQIFYQQFPKTTSSRVGGGGVWSLNDEGGGGVTKKPNFVRLSFWLPPNNDDVVKHVLHLMQFCHKIVFFLFTFFCCFSCIDINNNRNYLFNVHKRIFDATLMMKMNWCDWKEMWDSDLKFWCNQSFILFSWITEFNTTIMTTLSHS